MERTTARGVRGDARWPADTNPCLDIVVLAGLITKYVASNHILEPPKRLCFPGAASDRPMAIGRVAQGQRGGTLAP